MSDLLPATQTLECPTGPASPPVLETYPARQAALPGGLLVRRALPRAGRRLVGAWCFLDHYGPLAFDAGKPMDVAPHPHIGLQTVTWLFDGEVLHRDSLGSEQVIRPRQLNLMTAGRGIAHSEETPGHSSGRLHGIQLWLALPDAARHGTPRFEHVADLPACAVGRGRAVVLIGELAGARSPASAHSRVIGAELTAAGDGEIDLPLDPGFEHALLLIDGRAALADRILEPATLYYLGSGRSRLSLPAGAGARVMLLGGEPFGEPILMWWNFVARTPAEIITARDDWEQGRFTEVRGYAGDRIPAPALGGRLRSPESTA